MPINQQWLPDERFQPVETAPLDGTVVEVLPEKPGYVPPKRARYATVNEHRGAFRCWVADGGKYGFSVGWWRPLPR